MPQTFKPPLQNHLLQWFFNRINHPLLSRGITWVVDEESWKNWKSIPKGSPYFVASKHAHFTDHFCIGGLADRLGTYCLYVSIPEAFSDYWGMSGFVVRRLGGFAVERGGTNIQATRYVVEAFLDAKYPLVIFPEGELYLLNDVVMPIKPGTALFALEGAKARQKAGKNEGAYILPMGLKYVYREDVTPYLLQKLSFCEKRFFGKTKQGDVLARIVDLMHEVERDGEHRFQIKPDGATVESRYLSLSGLLVNALELEAHGKTFEGDFADRSRRLMTHFGAGNENFEKARFALHCLDFYPGYLDKPTPERWMETLRKLERIITRNENPSFPGKRFLLVKVKPPIPAHTYLPQYLERKTRKEALLKLTHDLQKSIEEAQAELLVKSEKVRSQAKPEGIL